jgi:hypothetical protein
MHIGDAHVVNLRKKLPYMLIRGLSVITCEFGKIQYPGTLWIWNHVNVLGVWFLVRSSLALRHEPKLL